MKNLAFSTAVVLFTVNIAFSQGTAINKTGVMAHSSAILDVSDTTKGILIPRMTKANKLAISSPATGLMVYQTDDTTGFWYFNSVKWVQAIGPAGGGGSCSYTIGQSYGGGIIFFIDGTGCHGLISASSDQSASICWSNITGAYSGASTYSNGYANTAGVIAQGAITGAAYICDTLSLNGYSDWYLPSHDELFMMYMMRNIIGGFASSYYWSSTETNNNYARIVYFSNGSPWDYNKGLTYRVRAIRRF